MAVCPNTGLSIPECSCSECLQRITNQNRVKENENADQ